MQQNHIIRSGTRVFVGFANGSPVFSDDRIHARFYTHADASSIVVTLQKTHPKAHVTEAY